MRLSFCHGLPTLQTQNLTNTICKNLKIDGPSPLRKVVFCPSNQTQTIKGKYVERGKTILL